MSNPNPTILSIGELLWDILPDDRQLGGAPTNFACHIANLGARSILMTRVGQDDAGLEAIRSLNKCGVDTCLIQQDETKPTGTAGVLLAPDGEPQFEIHQDVAWDFLAFEETAQRIIPHVDAIGFGTLAQRSPLARNAIESLLSSVGTNTLRILDINLRSPYWNRDVIENSLLFATVLKLSEQELFSVADLFGIAGDAKFQMSALADQFELHLVALTRGANGSLLYAAGQWAEHPGLTVTVRDAVGAGDAFTAALTLGLLRGEPLEQISRDANELAAYVCTQPGATPDFKPFLADPDLFQHI